MRKLTGFILFVLLLSVSASSLSESTQHPGELIPPAYPVPDYVEELLSVAAEEVGYTEGDHGWSKYGEWAGDPYAQWCAEFQCWCVDQTDQRYGTELLNNIYPRYSGQNTGRDWFIRQGRYVCRWGNIDGWGYQWLKGEDSFLTTGSYVPQPGDWVFFTWTSNTDTDHVAMVENCTKDENGVIWVNVIEGNKPSAVERFSYELTYSRILGFGTVHDVMDITMKFGNDGQKVLRLQEKLFSLGYLDQQYLTGHFGNATRDAVWNYQYDRDLKMNGIANIETQRNIDNDIDFMIDHDPMTWLVVDDDEEDTE